MQILLRRLFAADVLLARRKRQHEAAPALGIHGLAATAVPASGARISRASRTGRHRARRNSAPLPIDWPSPRRCRRPSRPAARAARATPTSVNTAISSAPLACAASAMRLQIADLPNTSGDLHDDAGRLVVDQRGEVFASPRRHGGSARPSSPAQSATASRTVSA